MSIRFGLLALLCGGDAHGYQLRARFEALTGSIWPLNVGQVYTTLARLERDGLVRGSDPDPDGRAVYRLTEQGRTALAGWWSSPVARADRPRDELAIKIALAVTTPGVDAGVVLQTQRADTMRSLQDLTRLKRHSGDSDLSWRLVLESMIFAAEAEIRWLDHCETALLRDARARGAAPAGAVAAPVAPSGPPVPTVRTGPAVPTVPAADSVEAVGAAGVVGGGGAGGAVGAADAVAPAGDAVLS